MHALITGAGGFVGGATARAFLDAGWNVTGVYRNRAPSQLVGRAGFRGLAGDLERGEGLPGSYDFLVHCAAEVPASCPDAERLYASNVRSTRNVLADAARAGAAGAVYMSSMAVYGSVSAPIVDERTTLNPDGAYGRSKADGEIATAEWAREKPSRRAVSIRLPGIVGAGGRNNFLCDTWRLVRAGAPVKARNPEARFNNVVHVKDLAAFVLRLAARAEPGYDALTLGAEEALTLREVLALLFRCAATPERIEWTPGGSPAFLIGFRRAVEMGYVPATVKSSIERFAADELVSTPKAGR